MEVFNGLDIGVYSTFRVLSQQQPELAAILHGSAIAGGYLWIVFLLILFWRWWTIDGRFPLGSLVRVLVVMVLVELLSRWLDRARPDDAQDFFGEVVGRGFPNGPSFRAVLISSLMWETSRPGWGRWLGLLGAVLYCVWVMMGQLMTHLGYLTDILAALALGLGLGLLSPRVFGRTKRPE